MEFAWTPEDEAFRAEVRTFLQREAGSLSGKGGDDEDDGAEDSGWELLRKLGQKGWLCVAWPTQYGGRGWSHMRQVIFLEEMARQHLPGWILHAGIRQIGPAIMIHGTDEQKERFLPPIARGEVYCGQLFSEPNAGSDLGSLQTTAIEDGDHFILNGQKTWSSRAHLSRWAAVLARSNPTAPKYKGIGYFIVDMRLPGITIRPLVNMADVHHFNEVFFENVRVSRDCLVGQKDQGWSVTTTNLNFERTVIRWVVAAEQYFEDLVNIFGQRKAQFTTTQREVLRSRVAQMAIEIETSRLLNFRVVWLQSEGKVPSYEASVAKVFTAEMTQRMVELGMEITGLQGQLAEGSPHAILNGKMQKLYRGQRAITIGAGTSEIQRNGIATRGLGLSREGVEKVAQRLSNNKR